MKKSELKFMQNSYDVIERTVRRGGDLVAVKYTVVTTMTKLFIYLGRKEIGSAGVMRAADFDYDSLLGLAFMRSGSSIMAA